MPLFGRRERSAGMSGVVEVPPYSMNGNREVAPVAQSRADSGYAIREAADSEIAQDSAVDGQTILARPSVAAQPLGGSMRQAFDYEAASRALAGRQKKPGVLPYLLAGVADAISNHYGNGGGKAVAMLSRMQMDQQSRADAAQAQIARWQYDDYARQNEADLRAASPFTIGRDRVQFDPATGRSHVLFDGPEDFELYAAELGLEPGTDDYFQAVEDYVLRSSGPSAHIRDIEMDDHRTDNDRQMELLRYGNRLGLENVRQHNRQGMVDYRNSNPPPARSRGASSRPSRQSVVSVQTPAEAKALKAGTLYRGPDGVVRER